MKENIMMRNLRRSIQNSFGRYLAIIIIIALGASIFVGLRTTRSDMIATGQVYMDRQNMFDLRLMNTYGWTEENVERIKAIDGIVDAEGMISVDALLYRSDIQTEGVYKVHTISQHINQVYLLGGRMPQAENECLADGFNTTDAVLGTTYTVTQNNDEDTLDMFQVKTYTVVGYISTPLFMDISRGTTSIGNGNVTGYLYVPGESMDTDYFTEVDVTISTDHGIYTEEYNQILEDFAEAIEADVNAVAQSRFDEICQDAEEEYQEGYDAYLEGLLEFEEGKLEADTELADAEQALLDAEAELQQGREDLDQAQDLLIIGQNEIDANRAALDQAVIDLETVRQDTYAELDSTETQLQENLAFVNDSLIQAKDGLEQIYAAVPDPDGAVTQLEAGLGQISSYIGAMETGIASMDVQITALTETIETAKSTPGYPVEELAQLEANLAALQLRRSQTQAQLDSLYPMQEDLNTKLVQAMDLRDKKNMLEASIPELEAAQLELTNGLAALEDGRTEAEAEFAAAEQEIADGYAQLDEAQQEIYRGWTDYTDGQAELADAESEIADGWVEYEEACAEVAEELAEAELELADAAIELADAREEIDALEDPEVYILDRNSNVGYLALDSNSGIVQGISAVFPAFFLLIAALVCITTMTRMVEEERTQIGTLKALGYSNIAIVGKYLAYAGSAAILGCGLGVIGGSVVFPLILWEAYGVVMNITPEIILLIDWPLCLVVIISYTILSLAVTWYCCRLILRDVPAELIRPKPPTSGKKIFLEYLPFWNRFSFLNKVMLRNIFRYKQRLLMMLVGIGGCTALLVTGFGIRDSIMDVVDIQFSEVTLFDMEVRFNDSMDEEQQEQFIQEVSEYVHSADFFYQTSVEVDHDNITRDISLVCGDESIADYFDFHSGDAAITLPADGEAMISTGVAQILGVELGEQITLRNSDMESMTIPVTGIFDNHVNNYVIVTPQTIRDNWDEEPECQMAYILCDEDTDVYASSAKIMEMDNVINVMVSEEFANQIGSTLKALDLVVISIVVSAGLLSITVLYNLTNINITERIREIATIKVLGFKGSETAAYVFKENLLLSAMGTVLGLFGGYWLLSFVLSEIRVDIVWFQTRILPASYIYAVILTMLSALVVDFVLYFRLEKINMAEALKSVE